MTRKGNPKCLCGGTGWVDDSRPGKPYRCPECVGGPIPASARARMKVERARMKADSAVYSYKVKGGNCAVVAVLLLGALAAAGWGIAEALGAVI